MKKLAVLVLAFGLFACVDKEVENLFFEVMTQAGPVIVQQYVDGKNDVEPEPEPTAEEEQSLPDDIVSPVPDSTDDSLSQDEVDTELMAWFGRYNGDRGTWYGSKNMNQYPPVLCIQVNACLPTTCFPNNGRRWEKGGQAGYVVKQSEVGGRGIALIVPRTCRSKVAKLIFKE